MTLSNTIFEAINDSFDFKTAERRISEALVKEAHWMVNGDRVMVGLYDKTWLEVRLVDLIKHEVKIYMETPHDPESLLETLAALQECLTMIEEAMHNGP